MNWYPSLIAAIIKRNLCSGEQPGEKLTIKLLEASWNPGAPNTDNYSFYH